jgi:hypothetical protein
MSKNQKNGKSGDRAGAHLTTRRGFVSTCGLGGLSLYFLWAAYGAAPTSFKFITASTGGGMGHGGHGGGGGAITPEAFEQKAEKFFEAHRLPDGSVKVARTEAKAHGHSGEKTGGRDEKKTGGHDEKAAGGQGEKKAGGHDEKKTGGHDEKAAGGQGEKKTGGHDEKKTGGHDEKAAGGQGEKKTGGHDEKVAGGQGEKKTGGHDEKAAGGHDEKKTGGHDEKAAGGHDEKKTGGHDEEPIDVYILSRRFGYQPEVLRLERGVAYKFRIMPMDADHGASINFGTGSRIIRCRAGVLSEVELRFEKKGEFFMYCTVYCGDGHDAMRSKIIVT